MNDLFHERVKFNMVKELGFGFFFSPKHKLLKVGFMQMKNHQQINAREA